mmetsp:Transcript_7803/g.22363  ORF Transcript_7803/g.22363 Transcript_7803/m.22363 type:complete len:631 (+) Transcript_7803:178-2070(+)
MRKFSAASERFAGDAQKIVQSSRRYSTEVFVPSVPELLVLLDTTPLRNLLESICTATSLLDGKVAESYSATADLGETVKSNQAEAQEQREKMYTALWAADRSQTERIQGLQAQFKDLQDTVVGLSRAAGGLERRDAELEEKVARLDKALAAFTEGDEAKVASRDWVEAELADIKSKVDSNEEEIASMRSEFDKKMEQMRSFADNGEESVIADLETDLTDVRGELGGDMPMDIVHQGELDGDMPADALQCSEGTLSSRAGSRTPDADRPLSPSHRSSSVSSHSPPPRPPSSPTPGHRPQSALSAAGSAGGASPVMKRNSSVSIPSSGMANAGQGLVVRGRSAGGVRRSSTRAFRDSVEAVKEAVSEDLQMMRSDIRREIADLERALKGQMEGTSNDLRQITKGLRVDLTGAVSQIKQLDVDLVAAGLGRVRNQVSAIEGDLGVLKRTVALLRDASDKGGAAGVSNCLSCYAARSPSPEPNVTHTFDGKVRYVEHQVLQAPTLPETTRQRAASAAGGCGGRLKTACGLPSAPLAGTNASPSIPCIANKGCQRPEAALGPFDLHLQQSGRDRRAELVVMRSAGGSYQRPSTAQKNGGGAKTHRDLVLVRHEQLQAEYEAMQRAAMACDSPQDG